MSLATRCTHCGTIFKVVQDQLKVSEGWVRCGRCNEVFNALPALFDLDTEAPPPRPAPAPTAAPAPAPAAAPPTPTPSPPPPPARPTPPAPPAPTTAPPPARRLADDFELDTAVPLQGRDTEPMEPDSGGGPLSLPMTNEADALESRYLMPSSRSRRPTTRRTHGPEFADAEFPSDALLDAEADWLIEPQPLPSTAPPSLARLGAPAAPPPAPPSAPPTPSPPSPPPPIEDDGPTTLPSRFADDDDGAATPAAKPMVDPVPTEATGKAASKSRRAAREPKSATPTFVRQARRQALWRHPGTRGLLSGLSLALMLTLAVQVAHNQRDWLAARQPELRPWLAQWCAWAQCRINLPRDLDGFQVDHATLVRAESEGPERYRLSLVVRSSTPADLAWPAVDVVLNDRNGQVLARRTLPVRAADWQAETPVRSAVGTAPPPGMPAGASGTLSWSLQLAGIDPAGYTAELFYP